LVDPVGRIGGADCRNKTHAEISLQ
jgi:hypothetical protein